jgi:hypothetical protein
MESLRENKPLLYCLAFAAGSTLFLAAELDVSINDSLQLVAFPDEFRPKLLSLIIADWVGSLFLEKVLKAALD